MKNLIRKYGLTILGLVFAGGTYLVENKQAKAESQALKDQIKKEVLEELKKGE